MELSSCCGAPLIVEFKSDHSNYSDDAYDLQIPYWVCSICGSVVMSQFKSKTGSGENETPPTGEQGGQ